MRARILVAVSCVLVGTAVIAGEHPVKLQDVPLTIGTPGEIPTRIPQESGTGREIKIRVERIWKTGPKTHAAVRVQNTAAVAFNDVSVVCTAVDAEDRAIGTSRQDLGRESIRGFPAGSVANLDLVFDTPASDVRSLTCDARARGLPRQLD
jgi:hypothetical protein